jgi:AraC-like DNA-binding protein
VTTVCIKAVRLGVLAAARRGLEPSEALHHLGLAPEVLADPSARVSHEVLVRAWTELPRLTGDAAFGLHAAEQASAAPFDVLDFATAQCATLRDAIEAMVRYQRLLHEANDVRLEVTAGEARLTQRWRLPEAPPRHLSECIAAQWMLRARALLGRPFVPRRVELMHAPPDDVSEHRRFFGVPLAFLSDGNGLRFDATLLDAPLVHSDPSLALVLRRHADDLLARLPTPAGIAAKLRRQLTETLASEPPDAERSARALGMSVRSLQRRLEEEGTSFKAVLDEARSTLALSHLRDPKRTVSEVAFLVGFSELSAFSRAFRRWTGQSPAGWRRGQVG